MKALSQTRPKASMRTELKLLFDKVAKDKPRTTQCIADTQGERRAL